MNQETTNSESAPQCGLGWRFRVIQDVPVGLAWLLGSSVTFLTIGIVGMFAADLPPITLKSAADFKTDSELPAIETTMAELQALNAEEPAEAEDSPPEAPPEVPEVVETPPTSLELPEIAEAMTVQDIFAIPTAPKIETALTPVDPEIKPKPRTTPTPRPTTAARATPSTGTATGTATSRSTGRMVTPAPPYPSFARARSMQGTVRLSISVGPSGAVEGASVIGSTGFSELDNYAAGWVRRNWRFPATGAGKRYTLPLKFQLR
jgi:TonB family protein